MARPKTFDEDRALDAAMRTFWANGYEATTTQDLCEATGLGRSSIYNTFTSKPDLFRRALARYIQDKTTTQAAVLEDEQRPALERLRTLLAMIVDAEAGNRPQGRSLGCLTVNTTVELAGRDAPTDAMLQRDQQRRLELLRTAISAGQRAGEITAQPGAADLALFLNTVIGGMRVAGQGGADRAALESIAATALRALAP
ncbi:TetR/AcrR family transcriptional regulator [Streptomonospora nanhaiensis]|uniref:AcrR family transcriptional regulator n=1 Tax=Streptomonospora nanhaiensis TaxID=1323731 RepID=A0A853BHZ0_9ACTN|nr:TetR/AcrR family transcriptional regulator [Streptomonospora nanhaiensis]MBV2363151.1 TetR/AcrR family transcriptional regulator [Streptomonospora nanhaiensis]MBX9389249.1 TetR/AcrR family transcriptional regulator [Streptomonospora nanhaiensis]NYI94355.1 AcrR family transcriptional regulator [Streptomonospora nanhaiensis]